MELFYRIFGIPAWRLKIYDESGSFVGQALVRKNNKSLIIHKKYGVREVPSVDQDVFRHGSISTVLYRDKSMSHLRTREKKGEGKNEEEQENNNHSFLRVDEIRMHPNTFKTILMNERIKQVGDTPKGKYDDIMPIAVLAVFFALIVGVMGIMFGKW